MTSSTPRDGAALDATTFDLDAWIDGDVRPEVTVDLYPHEFEYLQKVAAIEAKLPAAEKTAPANRGLDDPSPEALLAELHELREARAASALKVRVRQMTREEIAATLRAALEAEAPKEDFTLWLAAEASVAPKFTVAQLKRLRARDLSGESQVNQLITAADDLTRVLPVPSSPER